MSADRTENLRIGLMGTPDFAVPAFQKIIQSEYDVVCVYSQPPRPKGRGHKVQKSPVHILADTHDIPVFHPVNFKNDGDAQVFKDHNLDIAIVAAYGLILPENILSAPTYGCVNLHGSILPRWRGASPIQHAIWKGDEMTGMTLMQMDRGLDTGDMIAKEVLPLTNQITSQDLHDNLAQLGADMIMRFLDDLSSGREITKTPQNNEQVTYAPLLKKSDGVIDWSQLAREIDCQVRALNPWPGVFCHVNGKRMKILQAACVDMGADRDLSQSCFDQKTHSVVCGSKTVLQLVRVQPEGKKAMHIQDALNGGYVSDGDVFS